MADLTGILPQEWQEKAKRDLAPRPVEEQIHDAMSQAGITSPDHITIDGEIHRFKTTGKDKSGWYVFFPDNIIAGTFGDWREGVEHNFCANVGRQLTESEKTEQKARIKQAKAKREIEQREKYQEAATSVSQIWEMSSPASADHPYLKRKNIQPNKARLCSDGRLIVPLFDSNGDISSIQYISHDGEKMYHKGGKTGGCFNIVGEMDGSELYIAEGFATAATIHEATGKPCAAAYSASNIVKVAEVLAPLVKSITIVADNDQSGVGQKYADQASAKFGCHVITPPQLGDANDYFMGGGDLMSLLNPPQEEAYLSFEDDFCDDFKAINWLIKGWLPRDSGMMLFGPSGVGKSFLVLDWCLSIASRGFIESWHGKKVRHGVVVYLAGEGHHGIKGRVKAWRQHNNYNGKLDIIFSKSSCDLNTQGGFKKVTDEISRLGVEPVLIVVDTLHRFFDGDENSAKDSRSMLNVCVMLQQKYTSSSTMLIHHTGVSGEKRARGSGSWKGAMEVELSVSQSSGAIALECTKGKDTRAPEKTFFDLKQIELEGLFDEDNEQVTSAVIVQAYITESPQKDSKKHSFMQWFDGAWQSAGGEFIDNKNALCAYISRAALRAFLTGNLDMADRTADNHLKPSEGEKMVGYLISCGMIERYSNGYMVVCNVYNSKLALTNNQNAL